MKCLKCGAECPDFAKFCQACGSTLASGGPPPPPLQPFPPPPPPFAAVPALQPYAGFWLRFVANLLDSLILGLGAGLVIILFSLVIAGFAALAIKSHAPGLWVVVGLLYLLMNVVCILAVWFYYALSEKSVHQATWGKRAVGVKVTDLEGQRLSFGRASGRFWAKILSGLPLSLGYIMAGFTTRKQALHDYLAGTMVVRR